MFKTKRRKELEAKERELHFLKMEIRDLKTWCAEDSGEIAFAMLHLENRQKSVSCFRDLLRQGKYTFDEYRKEI